MELNLNLETSTDSGKEKRVREAKIKQKAAEYIPTLEEVFVTGWTNARGTYKVAIKDRKNSESDLNKIRDVYSALKDGELGLEGMSMKDISKSSVMNILYPKLVDIRRAEIIQKLIETAPENYYLVTTMEDLELLKRTIKGETEIGLDTETTGLQHTDHIVGYSVTCPVADKHFYVPFRHTTGEAQLPADVCMDAVKDTLEDPKVLKILHNVKFDHEKFFFDKYSIYLNNYVDTEILMYVLNENEPSYALKNLATKYGKQFGFEDKSNTYEELFGKGGFQDTPIKVGYIYACKDTHLTYKLYKWQLEHLKKQPKLWHVAFDIEMPLIPVLIKMRYRGFLVDMKFARVYQDTLRQEIKELEKKLDIYFPNINTASSQQLSDFLFNELGLDRVKGDSVDKDVLKALSPKYEGIEVLVEHRKLAKLMSTYIEPLPDLVWDDGFLHGELNQKGTKTGRLSSQNPNLQNIPPAARNIFIAPEGKLLLSCDFSKMEIYLACELSKDPNLYEALHSGADVYSVIASKSYGLPIEECGDGTVYRKHAKTALLGCMYGALPFTIAKQLDISVEEGEEILTNFFEGNPVLTKQIHKCHEDVATKGYVETLNGRKRRFPGIPEKVKRLNQIDIQLKQTTGKTGAEWVAECGSIWKANIPYKMKSAWYELNDIIQSAYRQSFNATDQGTGGDICKIALINLDKYFQELNKDLPPEKHYHLISSVHDEQLIELPEDAPEEVYKQIDYIMCNTMPLWVSMKTDMELYKTYYYDGKSVAQVLAGDLPKKIEG